MLGTAGEEAVYLWDLEEEGKVEVIRFKEEDRERVQVGGDAAVASYPACVTYLDAHATPTVHRVRRRLRLPLRPFADAHLLSTTSLQTRLVPTPLAGSEHPPFTR